MRRGIAQRKVGSCEKSNTQNKAEPSSSSDNSEKMTKNNKSCNGGKYPNAEQNNRNDKITNDGSGKNNAKQTGKWNGRHVGRVEGGGGGGGRRHKNDMEQEAHTHTHDLASERLKIFPCEDLCLFRRVFGIRSTFHNDKNKNG